MISATPDQATRQEYAMRVYQAINRATREQWAEGMQWYHNAHMVAAMLADGGDVKATTGAIAALSANKTWPVNVALAADACNGDAHGHTAQTLDKVRAILNGADPETVLPMDLKTGNFYRCILNPDDPDAVVIDRHAHDVAVGERWGNRPRGLKGKRYEMLADVYRRVARLAGILPSQVQAIAWLVWLEESTSHQGRVM